MAVNPDIPIPLYYQIKETIREAIAGGRFKPGDQLPPETDLTTQYGVSRMTVRQAVLELVNEGLLYRKRGKGTFVAEPKITQGLSGLTSFTEDMEKRGLRPSGRVLTVKEARADQDIAALLGIDVGAPVARLERLRLADDEPMALEVSYVPLPRFQWVLSEDLNGKSLYRLFAEKSGIELDRARQTIEVVVANKHEAGLLEVDQGTPLLKMKRVTYDRKGEPVEAVKSVYRADRYKFVMDLPRL
ncbi:MAG: phosphonate metabolism transcriptional regulator PhnF [Firmicutes bacterium]|nr:phosphonate metabolism transcriptional regulator PhnF [Bacillota bacterium]